MAYDADPVVNLATRIAGLQGKIAQRTAQADLPCVGSAHGRSPQFTASLEKELHDAALEFIGLKCGAHLNRWDPLEILRRMSLQRGQTV